MEPNILSIGGTPFGESDYKFLCQRAELRFRIKLSDYKPDQMCRRVASLAKQLGMPSFVAYAGLLERDHDALEQFLNLITINVTEFFRNSSLFNELAHQILPLTTKTNGDSFNVWSAGCSNGSEAYTVAMILLETMGDKPFKIKGTDIDLAIIAKAGAPSFTPAEMAGVSPERQMKYFSSPDDKTFMPKLQVRKNVQFTRHDLLADPYPRSEYDLILCRNVLIYFNDDARERIYEGFFSALKPGGILFVGGTERIPSPQRIGYESLQPFFYRKPQVALRKAA